MTLTLNPSGSTEKRRRFLDTTGAYLDRLPDNQAKAHRRRHEPTFDIRA